MCDNIVSRVIELSPLPGGFWRGILYAQFSELKFANSKYRIDSKLQDSNNTFLSFFFLYWLLFGHYVRDITHFCIVFLNKQVCSSKTIRTEMKPPKNY